MIACCAPTEDAEEEIKDEFYETLDTSTQELEMTIQEESWVCVAYDASVTTVRGFHIYVWKIPYS